MNRSQLSSFLDRWLARYPNERATAAENERARDEEAAWLVPFAGRTDLSHAEVHSLIDWKFGSMAHRRANARRGVDASWPRIVDRLDEAVTLDDEAALFHLLGVHGGVGNIGPAMASAFLTAYDPERFTIADTRALASTRRLGLAPPGPETFRPRDWAPYLGACRDLQRNSGSTLREVDQALWAAGGRD